MADRVCKWCGREYDGRRSATGGWAVCSEQCRQSLASSIDSGETEKNDGVSKAGCLIRLFLLILIVGFVRNCYHSAKGIVAESEPVVQTVETSEAKANSEELSPISEAPNTEPEAVEPVAPVSESVEEIAREESPAPEETAPESTTTSESETSLPPQNP